jgi:hypothetical protein
MHFSKIFSVVAVLAALIAGQGAVAQNGLLTTQLGSTTAILIDRTTWTNMADSKGHPVMIYPYFVTVAQLVANVDAGYVFLQTIPNSIMYRVVYNFTVSDDQKIKTWLTSQNQAANNVQVSIDPSWTGTTLNIDTTNWALTGANLNPYEVNMTSCDLTGAATCIGSVLTAATSRFSCIEEGIPSLKACFAPPTGTGCLAFMIQMIGFVTTYCKQSPGTLSSIVCTDKTEGTEAICAYIDAMLPSGVAGDAIVTADADGTMDSVNGAKTGAASGIAAAAGTAVAAAAIAAATLLL